MGTMNNFCWWLVKKFPKRVRVIKRNEEPYLLRFYITHPRLDRSRSDVDPEQFGVYIHHFFRGDEDPDLHNHPWKWALSFILAGSYAEEREDGLHIRAAGRFNLIKHTTFHRVTLLEAQKKPVWTLFTVGPRISSWGFKNLETGEFWDWKDYLRNRGESVS